MNRSFELLNNYYLKLLDKRNRFEETQQQHKKRFEECERHIDTYHMYDAVIWSLDNVLSDLRGLLYILSRYNY